MIDWGAAELARVAGATLTRPASEPDGGGPRRVVIDSRAVGRGDLFIGLAGVNEDGGAHAAKALGAGAWGVLVTDRYAGPLQEVAGGVLLSHPDPLQALAALASAWRAQIGARVIAITGSTGKTSTKDILAALIGAQRRTSASPENFNTEIGLPLAILAAPADTEVLVLEMAMRGKGQIAELTEIAKPDIGVIVNIGPVHLELLGSLEAIAAAKAELIEGLRPGASIVLPAGEALLEPHLREDLHTITFGAGADVQLTGSQPDGEVRIRHRQELITLRPSFSQSHNLENLLAAVAAARALGLNPTGELHVNFSAWRGEHLELGRGIVLINDCYNANPISMRAALDELARSAPARRVAVLGDMLELGPDARDFHRQIAEHASRRGIQLLVTVGELAAHMREGFTGEIHSVADAEEGAALLSGLLREGDTVLVKGSRGVGLERIASALAWAPEDGTQRPRAGAGTERG